MADLSRSEEEKGNGRKLDNCTGLLIGLRQFYTNFETTAPLRLMTERLATSTRLSDTELSNRRVNNKAVKFIVDRRFHFHTNELATILHSK